jgi:DNA mismatch endonuclease (patch repair protein)
LPGRPDLVFRRLRSVVFVHGCFWHQHRNCRLAARPRSNTAFWSTKLASNVERDGRNRRELTRRGWRVFVVWECQLSDRRLNTLAKSLRAHST